VLVAYWILTITGPFLFPVLARFMDTTNPRRYALAIIFLAWVVIVTGPWVWWPYSGEI
jgi:hypothetical protein